MREVITINLKKFKRLTKGYYEHLHANTFNNLEETGRFFKMQINKVDTRNIKSK